MTLLHPKDVVVYGASDDLIEVEGAIREEFYASRSRADYLAFSDGTVLSIEYGKAGCWNIRRVREGAAEYSHQPHDNDVTSYSDRVILRGQIAWVVVGGYAFAKAEGGAA